MAYITGDRQSRIFFPSSVEEYVCESDPVRVYDVFVDNLKMKELGITIVSDAQVGAPNYDPISMLKLLVYGYSYGIRSSRKLERACYHNVSFIWLMGGLKPDHKTISNFRRNNLKALKQVLKQCARLCMRLGLIDGNVLFVDGSKIRANASLDNSWSKERIEKYLEKLEAKIEELLSACDQIDKSEEGELSLVKIKEELVGKEKLQKKVKAILSELEEKGSKSVNVVDKGSVNAKGRQGTHASYNSQIVTDGKNGLIVNSEVISQSNDTNQFSDQIKKAEVVLEKEVNAACADAGYWQLDDLEKISSRGTQVVVPSKKQASQKEISRFDKDNFKYDEASDEYVCPEGKRLRFNRIIEKDRCWEYLIMGSKTCVNCKHYGVCTKSEQGRRINRLFTEELKENLKKLYDSPEGQKIFRMRKARAELPFGYIKRDLEAGYFLLRGREGVNGEMGLLATSFNIKRMMNLIGISSLLDFLKGNKTALNQECRA
jgi:transposase